MTIAQKQCLLAYLGYYSHKDIDGAWGELSQRATEGFQRDYQLTVDGDFGNTTAQRILEVIASGEAPERAEEATDDWWNEIEYFDRSEFKCTCGGRGCNGFPAEPTERLVRNANAARKHFGRKSIVSSGVRCALRNSELPGSAANSLHMRGKAMDFCVAGVSAAQLLAYVKTLPEVHEAYAIDGSFVHMGVQKY